VIIEQLNPIAISPDQDTDMVGGSSYRCTLLGWNTNDCIGDVSNFGSIVVDANCDEWSIAGSWMMTGTEIKFSAKAIENISDDDSIELVLNVDESNRGFFKTATASLTKGDYVVDIIDCCFRSGEQYTGHVEIEYQTPAGKTTKRFPNLGAFTDLDVARSNYRGLTIEITHDGGEVSAKLVSPVLLDGSGRIGIRFTAKEAFVADDLQMQVIEDSCAISYAQVKMMEQWHLTHNTGTIVEAAGQDYIINDQYIDGMQACVEKYSRPGFAWPTLDGQHFVGVPDSGIVSFKRVPELEEIVKAALNRVDIETILFPVTA